MAKFDYNDDSVVVIIGSGAGGGTLANELCQKGIKVVVLEAGGKQSNASFINDEWKAFSQLSWLDKRTTSGSWRIAKDFAGLPAWICKTVGGTTTHWAGASLRFQEHEFRTKTVYGDIKGANLLDWPITYKDLEPYYAKAENKMGVTRTNGIPGLPGNNNFKVMYNGATKLGYKEVHTGNMAVNSQLHSNVNLIAAGAVNGQNQANKGDGSTATAIGALATKDVTISTTWKTVSNQSLGEYYATLVSTVGADRRLSKTNSEYHTSLTTDLQDRVTSVTGVNLDEEMSNLIKYQHSYTAAAKLITTADQMLQTLLGLKQ